MKTTITKNPNTTTAQQTAESTGSTFNLKEAAILWAHTSKNGMKYLSGNVHHDEVGELKCTGFFNAKKKNPKEPDLRIYLHDEDGKVSQDACISLWANVSKNGKGYFSGITDEQEKVIAFSGKKNSLRIYYK